MLRESRRYTVRWMSVFSDVHTRSSSTLDSATLLVVANSSLNVFVYCYFSRHFSRAVRGVTARHRRAVLRDSLDSRRETISGATARPTPPRSGGGVQTFELAVRGVPAPLPTTSSREVDEQATTTDCEATEKQQNVTVVVTHNHDCL